MRHPLATPLLIFALVAAALSAVTPTAIAQGPSADGLRTGLPLVVLSTERAIRDDPKVSGRMRVMDHGAQGNTVRSEPNAYSGRMAVELRGQSSLSFPKKSYGVETRGGDGKDRKVPLLGMPPDGDWVLHSAWIDKTFMRNALAFEVARWMGHWAAQTRYVELVVNGRYQGVYVLMERPELGEERIDVEGKGLTGDYLLEWTFPYQARRKGARFGLPITGHQILYEDPERQDLSSEEAAYIRGFVRRTERALYGRGGSWRRLLDERSTVDYLLVQEIFKNVDAFHASTFLVKESGKPLQFSAPWDFDLSSGTARQGSADSTRGWWTNNRDWAERLYRDCGFRRAMRERWYELQDAGLKDMVLAAIDRDRATLIEGPARRNFRRWPVLDQRLWQAPRARGSFTAEVDHLRRWMDRRITWMDRAIGSLRC